MKRRRKPTKPARDTKPLTRALTTPSSALPFDAGATLPLVQRYTDLRFRAVAKSGFGQADVERQMQVVALARILPVRYIRHIFMWKDRTAAKVEGKAEEWASSTTLEGMHRANLDAMQPGHAVALVQAMREGGWVKDPREPLPDIVKLAMRGFRDEGHTIQQIADLFGFSFWTTAYAFRVPHSARMKPRRAGLAL